MREIIDGLSFVPRTCTWELTLRCNLNCGHCGSRAGKPRRDELDLEASKRVLGDLKTLGCRKISLSGGEPTLSPHWQSIAAEGSRLGMRMNMIVNGVGADREFVRRARDAGLVSVGVSLDGLEEVHDRNRGRKGLFKQVMTLLETAAAEGLPMGAITTVWRHNMNDLDAMHELLRGKVYVWQLQLGAAMGNLLDNRLNQVVPEDLLDIVPAIARVIRRGGVNVHVADNVGYYGPYEETLRMRRTSAVPCWIGCYAGCRHLGIEADGGVKGCLSLQATTATEGNVQRDSLIDIWNRKDAFAYNRAFRLDDLGGFCRTCEYASVCRGGCASMRTCEGGRDNPFCYHRVATLAQRKRQRRSRYVPVAVAPAALLALFGLGCGGSDETPAPVQDAGVDAPIGDAYGLPDQASYYGMPDPDASDENPPMGDAYGLPDQASYYGMPDPDASDENPPMGDAYGLPDQASYYGMPDPDAADESPPMGDAYGLPDGS